MRAATLLCLTLAALAGCRDREAPAARASAPAAAGGHPVGPIPGASAAPRPVTNPFAHDAAAIAEGRRLFVWFNCSGCHGGHAGGGMGPSLRDEVWLYGGGDADVYASIADGRAHGMPAWGTLLPPDAIWKMTAYVRTLRTPDEADPPQ
jgi:cytochrome c oxidase cbb3-type subunit 3